MPLSQGEGLETFRFGRTGYFEKHIAMNFSYWYEYDS